MPHRPKRKNHGNLSTPPGLLLPSDSIGETCLDHSAVIDLSRRVQRLELLLFRLPEPDFEKLDRQVLQMMSATEDVEVLPVHENLEQPALVVSGCEFFSIGDEVSTADDSGGALESLSYAELESKVELLTGQVQNLIEEVTTVKDHRRHR